MGLKELWVGFGSGKSYKDIPIHEVSLQLGDSICKTLPFIHAFTGCDLTSSMQGIGKKTAWNAWQNFLDVTESMIFLTENPLEFKEDSTHMQRLERLTILMYSNHCSNNTVNDARHANVYT